VELSRRADAVATSLARQELWPNHPEELYGVARELALCIPLVGKGKMPLADQAMTVLQKAFARGFKDRNQMQEDHALAPLRSRDDFQELLKKMQETAKPKNE
jgi:hypothetical protein